MTTDDATVIGTIVEGEVTNVKNFGAFVRLAIGEEGLVHISEIANEFVKDINDYVKVGEAVNVFVIARNKTNNKLELSLKRAKKDETPAPEKERPVVKRRPPTSGFEDTISQFLKRSEEKQIDIRRNLKNKQGISKRRR